MGKKNYYNFYIEQLKKWLLPIEDFQLLYPRLGQKESEQLYYRRVWQVGGIVTLTWIGIFLIILVCILRTPSYREGIQRGKTGEGSQYYQLEAESKTGKSLGKIEVIVKEQAYTLEQFQEYTRRLKEKLPDVIKKDNVSWNQIKRDIHLPSTYLFSGIQLEYIYPPEVFDSDGTLIYRKNIYPYKGEIEVVCRYGEWRDSFKIEFQLVDGRDRETFTSYKEEIEAWINANNEEEYALLPRQWRGEDIRWRQRDWSLLWQYLLASFIFCMGLRLWGKEKIKGQLQRRKEEIALSYPLFLVQLTILLGTGYPLRRCIEKIALEYEGKNQEGRGRVDYLHEEILKAYKELEQGLTESIVYQRLGTRCQIPEMIGLAEHLIGYTKKGNQHMIEILSKEASMSMEYRKRVAKRKGEEAGIKLLMPMMCMLLVVISILMVPALLHLHS